LKVQTWRNSQAWSLNAFLHAAALTEELEPWRAGDIEAAYSLQQLEPLKLLTVCSIQSLKIFCSIVFWSQCLTGTVQPLLCRKPLEMQVLQRLNQWAKAFKEWLQSFVIYLHTVWNYFEAFVACLQLFEQIVVKHVKHIWTILHA
jgi:hypothetical protein